MVKIPVSFLGSTGWIYGEYVQTTMAFFSHVEALCIGFHPILQRGVEKIQKRGAAIPHLNKELFIICPIWHSTISRTATYNRTGK